MKIGGYDIDGEQGSTKRTLSEPVKKDDPVSDAVQTMKTLIPALAHTVELSSKVVTSTLNPDNYKGELKAGNPELMNYLNEMGEEADRNPIMSTLEGVTTGSTVKPMFNALDFLHDKWGDFFDENLK